MLSKEETWYKLGMSKLGLEIEVVKNETTRSETNTGFF